MAYEQMAYLYDELMAHAPYDEWVDFTEKYLGKSTNSTTRIADLGCGTGEITTRLAKKGFQMVGIDYSEEMLTYAQHKAEQNNVRVDWLHQDIRNLSGLREFDMAISYCDVINYITEPEEIEQTFGHVYDLLKPGGLFLFDVHHLTYVLNSYINETFADVSDKSSYIWFCTPGDEIGEMYHDLTFFYLQNGKYERFDEQHHQRTFSYEFYKNILSNLGFENIKVHGDFNLNSNNVDENTMRIFFSAIKESR